MSACVETGHVYGHSHCPLCYCVQEVSLVVFDGLKTKVGRGEVWDGGVADQAITDILTRESGVETAFYQPPSVSCCFGSESGP